MTNQLMEIKKNKDLYETPLMIFVEVKQEGIICQSLGNLDPIDPFIPGGDPLNP